MNDERRRKRVRKAELVEGELVVHWGDEQTTRHALEGLRANCPCALCRETRDGDRQAPAAEAGLTVLTGEAATATGAARGFEMVGRYGLRITWADGHNHGIYALERLREGEYG